jgi:hypothetical protein
LFIIIISVSIITREAGLPSGRAIIRKGAARYAGSIGSVDTGNRQIALPESSKN